MITLIQIREFEIKMKLERPDTKGDNKANSSSKVLVREFEF